MPRATTTQRGVTLIAALAAAGLMLVPAAWAASAPAGPAAARAARAVNLDWPQYEHGPQHSSVSNATAFTPSNAASAHQVWHWQPPVISVTRRRVMVTLDIAGSFRVASPPPARVAEADGNRTRRRRGAPSAGFEDRGGHQAP